MQKNKGDLAIGILVIFILIGVTLYCFGLGILIWSIGLIFYGTAVIHLYGSNSQRQRILAVILMPSLLLFARPVKNFQLIDKSTEIPKSES